MEIDEIIALITLDKSGEIPLYAQVRDSLLRSVENGLLTAGTKLPPVRRLAEALDVNVMTIAKAYKELTQRGAATGRGALGTFVEQQKEPSPDRAAASYSAREDDTFGRMLQFSSRPGTIVLTKAYPDARVVGVDAFEQALKEIIDQRLDYIYSYVSPDGLQPLKEAFSDVMRSERSLHLNANDLVVTSGGQQAINIVAQSLLRPGDTVLVESPTYFGALDLFRAMGVRTVGVRMEADGLDIDELESLVKMVGPKLIFTIPTFHNPTGITTSLAKRKAMLAISQKYGVPILEDDCSAELRFSGEPLPSIKALSEANDAVYYFTSMGKVYVPGIRLGFVASPSDRLGALVKQKSLVDLHTSPLLQGAFDRYLRSGNYVASLENTRSYYKKILATIASELTKEMPEGTTFSRPDGGLNLWLKLPPDMDSVDFFYACLQRNVSILVGLHFYAEAPDTRTIRLSFGVADEKAVHSSIQSMGAAARSLRGHAAPHFPVLV